MHIRGLAFNRDFTIIPFCQLHPRVPRNGIDKRQLNDICGHYRRIFRLLVHLKCICGTSLRKPSALPRPPSWWGRGLLPPISCCFLPKNHRTGFRFKEKVDNTALATNNIYVHLSQAGIVTLNEIKLRAQGLHHQISSLLVAAEWQIITPC